MDFDLRKYTISYLEYNFSIIETFEYRGYKSDIWKRYDCFIALHHGRSKRWPYVVIYDDIESIKNYIRQCVDANIYRTENCEHCGRPY